MTPTLDLKRGDTLILDCQALQASGGPAQSLAGWRVRSQVRSPQHGLLAELQAAVTDPAAGRFTLGAPPSLTAAWPLGPARMDIEYTDPAGVVQSTETLIVNVIADETR